jgi:hypothetical protein
VARLFEGTSEAKQFPHALTGRYPIDDSSSIQVDEQAVFRTEVAEVGMVGMVGVGFDQDISYLKVSVNRTGIMETAGRFRERDAQRRDLCRGRIFCEPCESVSRAFSFDRSKGRAPEDSLSSTDRKNRNGQWDLLLA